MLEEKVSKFVYCQKLTSASIQSIEVLIFAPQEYIFSLQVNSVLLEYVTFILLKLENFKWCCGIVAHALKHISRT